MRPPEITDFDNYDIFQDKKLCQSLSELAENTKHGLVVSLESDWGNGKTTFVKRWKKYLEDRKWHDNKTNGIAPNEEIKVVYIDAFERDYFEDPFESIFKEILRVINKDKIDASLQGALFCAGKNIIRELAICAAKKVPVVGEEISNITANIIDGTLENYINGDADTVAEFKDKLNNAILDIRDKTDMPLIVILDELDCETRFFRATGSQYREPLARGDQSRRRGAESHRSKHKYKEPPELRRRRLFVFNQLNVWKYCL